MAWYFIAGEGWNDVVQELIKKKSNVNAQVIGLTKYIHTYIHMYIHIYMHTNSKQHGVSDAACLTLYF